MIRLPDIYPALDLIQTRSQSDVQLLPVLCLIEIDTYIIPERTNLTVYYSWLICRLSTQRLERRQKQAKYMHDVNCWYFLP